MLLALVLILTLLMLLAARFRAERRRGAKCDRRRQILDGYEGLLLERLREYARRMGIPVGAYSAETLRDWRKNTSAAGQAIRVGARFEIRIREDHVDSPWVLAHELGHVASWQAGGASSEMEADCEAEKIMLSVLTAEERDVVGKIIVGVLRSQVVRESAARAEAEARELDRKLGRRKC